MGRKLFLLVQALALVIGSVASAGEALDKKEVLTLLEGGFGEDLIVEKIRESGVDFELAVSDMVELKKAGATDRILQAILESRTSPVEESPPGGISTDDMVLVPAGDFTMGYWAGEKDFSSEHTVHLDAFVIDRHEVTNAEYEKLDPTHQRDSESQCDDCPVTNVNWAEAATYARRVGKRLPTEAEWEKAARGPEGHLFGYGKEYRPGLAQLQAKNAVEGGRYPANGYGVFDMLGNVWEWCADTYGEDYYENSPERNPTGPPRGPGRVLRGGCYKDRGDMHLAMRTYKNPRYRYASVGFRCVRDVAQVIP